MKLIDTYGVYRVFETADRDGSVWEVHIGIPPTRLTEIHAGTNLNWALLIAKGLAKLEEIP